MHKRKIILAVIVALILSWLAIRRLNAYARASHTLGATNGQLAECLDRPNCVSSASSRAEQSMPAIELNGSAADAIKELTDIVQSMPGCRVVTSDEHYLHAEFRSRFFGFIDDVEFLVDEANGVIHFRSASRVGYSDLGVNRKRMAAICQRFETDHSNTN